MVNSSCMPPDWATGIMSNIWNFDGVWFELGPMIQSAITAEKVSKTDVNNLMLELLRGATMTCKPQMKMFECIKILVHSENVTWADFLLTMTRFTQYHKLANMLTILDILRQELPRLTCSYTQTKECEEFTDSIIELFSWFVDCLHDRCTNGEPDDYSLIMTVIDVALAYIADGFVMKILQLGSRRHIDHIKSAILEPLVKMKSEDVPLAILRKIEEFDNALKKSLIESPVLAESDLLMRICGRLRRSGIRSLSAVFMSFRVLTPLNEMVETMLMFGTIYGYESELLIIDFLHAALLTLLQDQQTKDDLRLFGVSFFFVKVPRALRCFVDREFATRETVASAFQFIIRNFKQELDSLDAAIRESSVSVIMRELCSVEVLDKSDAEPLLAERQEHIKAHAELHQTLITNQDETKPVALVMNKQIKLSVEKTWQNAEKMPMILRHLITSGTLLVESLCTTYCLEGNVSDLTHRIATMCRAAEDRAHPDRQFFFDVTFSLLSRIAFTFPSLTLEEFVAGADGKARDNYNGVFYRWCSRYMKRIRPTIVKRVTVRKARECAEGETQTARADGEEAMEEDNGEGEKMEVEQEVPAHPIVSDEMKQQLRDRVIGLKDRHIFWDSINTDFDEAIDLVPAIGSVWLDEFRERKGDVERLKHDFKVVVSCFRHISCMAVALTQWLECQTNCDALRLMARTLHEAIKEYVADDERWKAIWNFVRTICHRQLVDIYDAPTALHPLSITLKSVALRTFPHCLRLQVPDTNQLKDGWLYAQRQNWFNHKTLLLIDHCNQAKQHRTWIRMFIQNLLKLNAQDMMGKAVEFICAVLLLDPIRSVVIMLEVLFDFLLPSEESEDPKELFSDQHATPFVLPLAKLAVQSLFIGIWVVDWKKRHEYNEGSKAKKARMDEGVKKEEGAVNDKPESEQVNELLVTIKTCIQKINQQTKQGSFNPSVSMVLHIIKMIARAPHSKSKLMLIQLIPHDLIFRLARLEPCGISLEMFSQFCEPSNEEHEQEKLRFLCMLRSCGGL